MKTNTPLDDGGPAFPIQPFTQPNGEFDWGRDGMSLRDWFAGMAMKGIAKEPGEGCDGYIKQRARVAYAIADAMIEARK